MTSKRWWFGELYWWQSVTRDRKLGRCHLSSITQWVEMTKLSEFTHTHTPTPRARTHTHTHEHTHTQTTTTTTTTTTSNNSNNGLKKSNKQAKSTHKNPTKNNNRQLESQPQIIVLRCKINTIPDRISNLYRKTMEICIHVFCPDYSALQQAEQNGCRLSP